MDHLTPFSCSGWTMRKRILPVLLTIAVMACGGDKATGPNADVTGNYTLQTANGNSVPAVVYLDTQEKDELTAGNINLNSDHTWSGSLSLRSTDLTSGDADFTHPSQRDVQDKQWSAHAD